MELLRSNHKHAYREALTALPEDTQEWWAESIEPKSDARDAVGRPYTGEAASLLRFLEDEVTAWLNRYCIQLQNRLLVREQAFGESMDPEKLERMLAILFRPKELRRPRVEEG